MLLGSVAPPRFAPFDMAEGPMFPPCCPPPMLFPMPYPPFPKDDDDEPAGSNELFAIA